MRGSLTQFHSPFSAAHIGCLAGDTETLIMRICLFLLGSLLLTGVLGENHFLPVDVTEEKMTVLGEIGAKTLSLCAAKCAASECNAFRLDKNTVHVFF